ncbi:hypothetical protein F4781DRAFT_435543 [Annulohypoxylon bovei var. microspora]|nr:hypothetical protein F4781DRAFT_435543 [Annulohypoxylon bovei var. microspora]
MGWTDVSLASTTPSLLVPGRLGAQGAPWSTVSRSRPSIFPRGVSRAFDWSAQVLGSVGELSPAKSLSRLSRGEPAMKRRETSFPGGCAQAKGAWVLGWGGRRLRV